jgi:drug/metabolite transporter (DMT)-like permease
MTLAAHGRASIGGATAALMVLLTFIWGFNQVAVKVSTDGYSPVFLTMARSAIGLGVLVLWCRWRGIPLLTRDGTFWPGVAAGALFGLEFLLIYWGIAHTTVARGALMINTMPFFVALGGHFLLGERLTWTKVAGLVAAFGGVALVFSDRLSLPSPDALWGDFLCVLAGAAWAATMLVIKGTRLRAASGEKTLAYQLAVSAVMVLPLLPFTGPAVMDPTWLATGSLLFQGVFVVGVTYAVWFWLVRRHAATGLSSFTFLSPVFGVVCGAALLGDPVTWRVVAALVLVVVGLVLVNRVGNEKEE